VLAGRYEVGEEIAVGGMGVVHEVRDRLFPDRSLVGKLLLPGARAFADDALRRERANLRWAQLPGVVPLLDEGVEDGWGFLVMPWIVGCPFPEVGWEPAPWEDIARPFTILLETVARLHLRGVVHADLKPSNVILQENGLPVVLDFGLSSGVVATMTSGSGTFAYAAPELERGEAVDARADIYSLGVMLFAALAGEADGDVRMLLPAERGVVRDRLAHVRPELAELVARMLRADRSERPADLLEVLDGLGVTPTLLPGSLAASDGPARDAVGLESWFHGPRDLLHLPEDAAATLYARTGGASALVRDELDAWVRAGFAVVDGDRVRIDRASIERLRTIRLGRAPVVDADDAATYARLQRAWVDVDGVVPLPDEAASIERLARGGVVWRLGDRVGVRPCLWPVAPVDPTSDAWARSVDEGVEAAVSSLQLGRAMAALESAVILAAAYGESARADTWCARFVSIALVQQGRPALNAATYLVDRRMMASHAPDLVALDKLLEVAKHRESGDLALAWRALTELDQLGIALPEHLEVRRMALQLFVASRREHLTARVFDELPGWVAVGPPGRGLVSRVGWFGRYYQAREFERAADVAIEAYRQGAGLEALGALHNVAMALSEVSAWERLREVLELALPLAVQARAPVHEAALRILERRMRYRLGDVRTPRPELAWAARSLRPSLLARLALGEAAIAWRSGLLDEASQLALCAREASREVAALSVLCEALWGAIGGVDVEVAAGWVAAGHTHPGVAMQIIGLARIATKDPPQEWAGRARLFATELKVVDLHERREVLSVVECWRDPPRRISWCEDSGG
jgi:hypothetical protein